MQHYLTGLVFIEISHARGDALDLEPRRGNPTEPGRRRSLPILRVLTTWIRQDRRSDDVCSPTQT